MDEEYFFGESDEPEIFSREAARFQSETYDVPTVTRNPVRFGTMETRPFLHVQDPTVERVRPMRHSMNVPVYSADGTFSLIKRDGQLSSFDYQDVMFNFEFPGRRYLVLYDGKIISIDRRGEEKLYYQIPFDFIDIVSASRTQFYILRSDGVVFKLVDLSLRLVIENVERFVPVESQGRQVLAVVDYNGDLLFLSNYRSIKSIQVENQFRIPELTFIRKVIYNGTWFIILTHNGPSFIGGNISDKSFWFDNEQIFDVVGESLSDTELFIRRIPDEFQWKNITWISYPDSEDDMIWLYHNQDNSLSLSSEQSRLQNIGSCLELRSYEDYGELESFFVDLDGYVCEIHRDGSMTRLSDVRGLSLISPGERNRNSILTRFRKTKPARS